MDEKITINGTDYIRADLARKTTLRATEDDEGHPYVILRCTKAGVHAGWLTLKSDKELELTESRRIWYWKGAASLSELAVYGASNPKECRFGACVPQTVIPTWDICEVIYCCVAGAEMIKAQPEWRASDE